MADPYLGEIRRFPTSAIPDDWLPCNGQTLPIARYQALYDAIGTTYGGDGKTTFALPDLQAHTPVGQGGSAGPIGTAGGFVGASQSFVTVAYAIAYGGAYPQS